MKIGFTGTKQGMTSHQIAGFYEIIGNIIHISEFHHGDCVGADEQAHNLIRNCDIIVHPPSNPSKRAFCKGYKFIWEEKDYLDRNHDIVDACDLLVATPCSRYEVTRSGTWATVRYARKRNKRIIIIWPEGDYAKENFEE